MIMKKTSIILTLILFALTSPLQINAQSTSSILFDGTEGKVTFPNSASTNISEGSYGAWIRLNASPNQFQRIIYRQGIELFYYPALNKFRAEIVLDGGFLAVQTNNVLSIDTAHWYHLMVTYDTTELKIYVDGNLNNSISDSFGAISTNSNDWGIGASPSSSIHSFNGEIDEVMIFDRALFPSEIKDLVCQQVDSSDAIYSDLVAYYKFDENTGSITTDEINGNDATLLSGTSWSVQGMPNFIEPQIDVNGNVLSSSVTGLSYQWYLNGSALPSDTNIFIIPQANGNYQVEVLYEFGCLWMSDIESVTVIGIEEITNLNNQTIYPNPSNGVVSFTKAKNIASVHFIDVMGKTIYSTSNTTLIDISQLKSGLYLVKTIGKNNRVTLHKLYLQ